MSYLNLQIKCNEAQADTLSAFALDEGSVGTSYEEGILQAYFEDAQAMDSFEKIALHMGHAPIGREAIEDRNWNALWEEHFHDQVVGDIHIRAPFHPPKELPYQIVIHPKMAFGTGHHGTTRLMLQAIRKLDLSNKLVLDMGCGSGILAILASLQGASQVTAIDYDINSVENCTENVQLNKISNVEIVHADSLDKVTTTFDIILSNIVKNINLGLLDQFTAHLAPGGLLVLCGLLGTDLEEVSRAASALHLTLLDQATEDEWLQLTFQHA